MPADCGLIAAQTRSNGPINRRPGALSSTAQATLAQTPANEPVSAAEDSAATVSGSFPKTRLAVDGERRVVQALRPGRRD